MSDPLIDCQGLPCPQPLLRAKKLLEETDGLNALVVLVDNQAAVENVSRFLGSRGFTSSVMREHEKLWRITAQGDGRIVPAAVPDESEETAEATDKVAIIISSAVFGSGDDNLGGRLMRNFLSTLPEFGAGLWRLILLNGGVTLSAPPSDMIDRLQAIERMGTKVLVCGACLEHFGLLDAKQVGETTNMLDIVTCMQLADKVIKV